MTAPDQTTATQEHLSTADFAAVADRRPPVQDMPSPSEELEAVERKTADRADAESKRAPLFAANEAEGFRGRWSDIQAGFVDEPHGAVEQADGLVAEVMQRLAQVFADERRNLEQRWDRGGETDTEELRQALRRYRSFFDRLLAL